MFLQNHNKTALISGEKSVSYYRLLQYVGFYSSMISCRNERIAIFSENREEWVYSFWAIMKSNNMAVTIDFMAAIDELTYIINDCTPKIIFTSNANFDKLSKAVAETGVPVEIINFDKIVNADVLSDKLPAEEIPDPPADQVIEVLYTSGTTGSPKGVMLTYDNFLANALSTSEGKMRNYEKVDRFLILLPLHHSLPLSGTLVIPMWLGATCVLCTSMVGSVIMETLQKHKITMMIGVPRLYEAIIKGIREKINQKFIARVFLKVARILKSKTFSKIIFKEVHNKLGGNIKMLVCGGAALAPDIARDYKALGLLIMDGYGMTECGPLIAMPRYPGKQKKGSIGPAILHCEVKIIDGEICCRGRNVMKGYYNKPKETAELIYDGWLHTGDLGSMDREGFVYITGRKKEIIILPNGKNINPVEIEVKLQSISPNVSEVGVFMKDNLLHAIILPDLKAMKSNEILNVGEYIKWEVIDVYNKTASPYKKIMKHIIVAQELPRTRMGKIQRFKLDKFVEESSSYKKDLVEPDTAEYKILKKYLQEQKARDIYPDDHIEIDLGLDSLDKVELQAFFGSRFGTEVTEMQLVQFPTVAKLAELITDNKNKIEDKNDIINWHEILSKKYNSVIPKSGFPHGMILSTIRLFVTKAFKYKAVGAEKISNHPMIIAVNHQSHLDWGMVSAALSNDTNKMIYTFAKKKHFNTPFRSWISKRCNVIVMDINKDLHDSIKKMATVLQSGKSIIIFPEGTRGDSGNLGPFKKIFAILSVELKIPVQPVVLVNTHKALPSGAHFIKPFVEVSAVFLPKIEPGSKSYDELSDEVHKVMEATLKTNS